MLRDIKISISFDLDETYLYSKHPSIIEFEITSITSKTTPNLTILQENQAMDLKTVDSDMESGTKRCSCAFSSHYLCNTKLIPCKASVLPLKALLSTSPPAPLAHSTSFPPAAIYVVAGQVLARHLCLVRRIQSSPPSPRAQPDANISAAIGHGGSATIVYGIITVFLFVGASAASLAEIASVYPTAGVRNLITCFTQMLIVIGTIPLDIDHGT